MREDDFYSNERYREQFGERESVGQYTAKTFLWMFLGLLTTFAVALAGYGTKLVVYALISIPMFHIIVLVAELAVVLVLSARIQKLSVTAARVLFFVYAALTGIMFSTYFLIFELGSLVLIFGMTSLYFGALAAYGYVTKTDLSRLRPILVGGLIFLIIMGLITMFIPMAGVEKLVCLVGIVIFLGFTAYDTQKIKALHAAYSHDPEMAKKASIYAALQLYLDFINLFLYLLRFMGRRRS